MHKKIATLAALLLCGCATDLVASEVSIRDVYQNPSVYDGRRIKVRGVLTYETENIGIYEDAAQSCAESDLAFALSTSSSETHKIIWELGASRRVWVVLSGTFNNSIEKEIYDDNLDYTPSGDLRFTIGVMGPGPMTDISISEVIGNVECASSEE